MAKRKLPLRIFVKRERDSGDGSYFLSADETPDSLEDGDVVGIYTLTETSTVRVRRELTK